MLNTPPEVIRSQVEANLALNLPLFVGGPTIKGAALIVGGGPSLNDMLPGLRFHQGRKGIIFALNGAHDWLIERGITPDFHVLLDARKDNARFVQNPCGDVTYLIATQCHPSVFEALKGQDVIQWNACLSNPDHDREVAEKFKHKPVMMVGGGSTVGLKTINLAYLWGFRKIHLYGFDSSYKDGKNHAYRQDINDSESLMEVTVNSRTFTCAPWMANQANEFQDQLAQLDKLGVSIHVHGDGLIPWINKQHMERAA
jgi:hypothetical protein